MNTSEKGLQASRLSALSPKLQNSRDCLLIVEGSLKEAREKNINYSMRKSIMFEITSITIKLKDGTIVGSIST